MVKSFQVVRRVAQVVCNRQKKTWRWRLSYFGPPRPCHKGIFCGLLASRRSSTHGRKAQYRMSPDYGDQQANCRYPANLRQQTQRRLLQR